MFNNFAQQINTPNVSGNGHSVILACNKSINYIMVLILNSQRPFLTTWYTFGKGGTLFATKLYRVVQFWLRKLYQVVPFISAGKKRGGDQIFQRGTDFFSKYWSPRTIFFLKYLIRGDCFWGDQLLRDSPLAGRAAPPAPASL